jgi:SlyX protein
MANRMNQNSDVSLAIESLEIKLAYQEDITESLNQTIIQQQEQIDILQHKLEAVLNKVNSLAEPDLPTNDQIELPPHF